ncbi:ABC transporter substrate-binding protein [Mesobacillus maritimus]|uniref:ABC transporter substrate-binding protein n=1 Tax=Mesobacillus maritimus TaxID=1643336 RepID=UPI00384DC404
MKKKIKFLSVLFSIMTLLAACSSSSTPTNETSDGDGGSGSGSGGTIHAAIPSQPATLDPHMNTAVITSTVARNVYEQLLTLNSNYEPVPMLAESVDISEDGKTYTFLLRQGVKFHNGEEMVAEDVVASLEKWIEINSKANLFKDAEFAIKDEYTVVLNLPQRVFGILEAIADKGQFSGIMPKEIAESAGPTGAEEYIGTGPFKFEEWKQDQYIHLTKFEDYSPLDTAPDGLAGKKEALVDEIYFEITADASTRLAGIQTGEFDVSEGLLIDNYEQLKANPDLEFKQGASNLWLVFNKKQGVFTDNNMRKAVNAALNKEEILIGVQSFEEFYRMDSSYMYEEQKNWHSQAGSENYDVNDVAVTKELLDAANYNEEEIRILTTRDYDHLYNTAVIAKEQLEKAGMKVKLDVYDWSTLLEIRSTPEEWDIFITGFPPVLAPTQMLILSPDWPGWTNDEQLSNYLTEIKNSTSNEEAQQIWDEAQGYLWDYLPGVKVGDMFEYVAHKKEIEGLTFFEGMVLWNVKKTQ